MYQALNPYTFIWPAYGLAFLAIVIYTGSCMLLQRRLHAAAKLTQDATQGTAQAPITPSSEAQPP